MAAGVGRRMGFSAERFYEGERVFTGMKCSAQSHSNELTLDVYSNPLRLYISIAYRTMTRPVLISPFQLSYR